MSEHPHIIGKQFVDIDIAAAVDGFAVQHEISRLFQARIADALGELFSRYADDETFIRIDRLEVDLGDLDPLHLEEEVESRVMNAVEKALATHLAESPRAENASGSSRAVELWQFYLRKGHFPWWASHPSQSELEERVLRALNEPSLMERARAVLAGSDAARRRLAMQFSEQFLHQLVDVFARGVGTSLVRVPRVFARAAREAPTWRGKERAFRDAMWREALDEVFARRSPVRLEDIVLRSVRQITRGDSAEEGRAAPERRHAGPASSDALLRRLFSELGLPEDEVPASKAQRKGGATQPDAADERFGDRSEDGEDSAETSADTPMAPSDIAREHLDGPAADDENDAVGPSHMQHPPTPLPDDSPRSKDGARSAEGRREADYDSDKPKIPARQAPRSNGAGRDLDAQDPAWWRSTELPESAGDGINADEGIVSDHLDPTDAVETDDRVIYVANAGLVLLHPFIAAHFERLGLVREGTFTDDDARQLAVHQLQYLAGRETSAPEYVMVLNKILCGLRPSDTIARALDLDDAFKNEGERLLESAIEHWKALKNTSPDGLREAFLRREGKLTPSMDGWKLDVERKSYDILLNRLPWGLGIVKLPWMPQLLHVQWA